MTVRWLTIFIDLPAESFDQGASFWSEATGTQISSPRGDTGQFATLLPSSGDSYVRVQRIDDGPGGIHLDLHVDDTKTSVATAVVAGAEVVAVNDVTVLRSPGGFVFCIVDHNGEANIPPTSGGPDMATRLNQVCIDIPHDLFEAECEFWSALTDWPLRGDLGTEFGALMNSDPMPFRVLFQRLGSNDPGTIVRAHLDIGAGDAWPSARHEAPHSGVTHLEDGSHWAVFRDPVGNVYCVTARDPSASSAPRT